MTEILPGVHLVDGVSPSPDFSMNVYLLKDPGATWTLIDTGVPGSEAKIGAYLAAHKIEPTAVRKILITHLHNDHVGGLRKTAGLTRARTFAHWIDAAYIAGRPKYDGPGMPPSDPVTIDEVLKDGDAIDAAGGLTAIHTPGHTPGHTAFYQTERKLLFSGDLLFGDGPSMSLTPKEYTHHLPTATISARRVAQLAVDSVLSYHGGPFVHDGGAKLRALVEKL